MISGIAMAPSATPAPKALQYASELHMSAAALSKTPPRSSHGRNTATATSATAILQSFYMSAQQGAGPCRVQDCKVQALIPHPRLCLVQRCRAPRQRQAFRIHCCACWHACCGHGLQLASCQFPRSALVHGTAVLLPQACHPAVPDVTKVPLYQQPVYESQICYDLGPRGAVKLASLLAEYADALLVTPSVQLTQLHGVLVLL